MHIGTKLYNLDPTKKKWNVDLQTRAILVNNPGNPCGNVFDREHLLDIIDIAERHKLPIVADEIYEFVTFPGVEFHSIVDYRNDS